MLLFHQNALSIGQTSFKALETRYNHYLLPFSACSALVVFQKKRYHQRHHLLPTCSATIGARTGMAASAVQNLLAGLNGLQLPEPITG